MRYPDVLGKIMIYNMFFLVLIDNGMVIFLIFQVYGDDYPAVQRFVCCGHEVDRLWQAVFSVIYNINISGH